jgi:hypothetical protein
MSSEIGRENSARQLGQRRSWLLPDIDAHCRMHLRCNVQPQGGSRNLTLESGVVGTSHHCGPCCLVNSHVRGRRDSCTGRKWREAGADALAIAAAEESTFETEALHVGHVAWRASHREMQSWWNKWEQGS